MGLLAGLLAGLGVLLVVLTIRGAENSLCQIQQRGAAARPYLVASLDDIHQLLAVKPTTPAQKQAAAQESPDTKHVIAKLNTNLNQFVVLENQIPEVQTCR